jgi:hypothetical protein
MTFVLLRLEPELQRGTVHACLDLQDGRTLLRPCGIAHKHACETCQKNCQTFLMALYCKIIVHWQGWPKGHFRGTQEAQDLYKSPEGNKS